MKNQQIATVLALLVAKSAPQEVAEQTNWNKGYTYYDTAHSLYERLTDDSIDELTFDQLKLGYGTGYPDSTGMYKQIDFNKADGDGSNTLSFWEFENLVQAMRLRTGFKWQQDRFNPEGMSLDDFIAVFKDTQEDMDEMAVTSFWYMANTDRSDQLSLDEFECSLNSMENLRQDTHPQFKTHITAECQLQGIGRRKGDLIGQEDFIMIFRQYEPVSTNQDIFDAWKYADLDATENLDWEEFDAFYTSLLKNKKHRDDMQWYWDRFAANPEGDMFINEFRQGFRLARPDVTEREIQDAWRVSDEDGSESISWREFEHLFENMSNARLGTFDSYEAAERVQEDHEGEHWTEDMDLTVLYMIRDLANFQEGVTNEVEFMGQKIERGNFPNEHQLVIENGEDGEPRLKLMIQNATQLAAGAISIISTMCLI